MKPVKKLYYGLSFVVALLANVSCDSNEPNGLNERKDIKLSESATRTATELQDFYTDFTAQVVDMTLKDNEKINKNTIVSPLSASMLFGMIANGMDDETQAQKIAEYLGVSDLNALNELSATLLSSLPSVDNKSTFLLKNSIWTNKNVHLSDDFSSNMRQCYKAELSYQDFSDEKKALAAINNWCSRQTNNLISSPINSINGSDLAVLINALLFKSKWFNEHEFSIKDTKPDVFHGYNGDITIDFMSSDKDKRTYQYSPNFSSCSLYFGNAAYCLSLVLPDEKMSKDNSIPTLNSEEMRALAENQQNDAWIKIKIPKFSVTGNVDLEKLLTIAGVFNVTSSNIWSMFTPAEKGSLMMQQNTSFEIDEEGVKVAVVSHGVEGVTANEIDPNLVHTMVFDRPFYFFLTERSTGACLLSGLIADFPQ